MEMEPQEALPPRPFVWLLEHGQLAQDAIVAVFTVAFTSLATVCERHLRRGYYQGRVVPLLLQMALQELVNLDFYASGYLICDTLLWGSRSGYNLALGGFMYALAVVLQLLEWAALLFARLIEATVLIFLIRWWPVRN